MANTKSSSRKEARKTEAEQRKEAYKASEASLEDYNPDDLQGRYDPDRVVELDNGDSVLQGEVLKDEEETRKQQEKDTQHDLKFDKHPNAAPAVAADSKSK